MTQEKNSDKKIKEERVGLVVLYTGNGKGKTTAAMGMLMRAWGRGMQVCAIQFVKSPDQQYGESLAAGRMGIEIVQVGDGCTWQSKDMDKTIACAVSGWEFAKQKIMDTSYDIILLDEFTYPFHFGWLDVREVLKWLKAHKPPNLHLVLTGRYAPPELIEYANLVTEMVEVKHPFKDEKLLSQIGVDF